MAALVAESQQNGIWTLQAGIFPENGASVGLHQRFGFRVVGVRERIGQMKGVWRDVMLMDGAQGRPTLGIPAFLARFKN